MKALRVMKTQVQVTRPSVPSASPRITFLLARSFRTLVTLPAVEADRPHRGIPFIRPIAVVLVTGFCLLAFGCRNNSQAPGESQATEIPSNSPTDTGLPCDNVVTELEIRAMNAEDKLTLPFEPCAVFEREPASVIGGYDDSPSVDFFIPAGTRIVAPWDGTLEIYPSEAPLPKGGYVALVSNMSKTLNARIYLYEDESNPAYGKFLGDVGQLASVRRGDLIGFVGLPLPREMTDTGAALELQLADWTGTEMLDPVRDEYWVGAKMNFYVS